MGDEEYKFAQGGMLVEDGGCEEEESNGSYDSQHE